jgi:hypothetical protein
MLLVTGRLKSSANTNEDFGDEDSNLIFSSNGNNVFLNFSVVLIIY